jgi:hypothetical protein
VWGERAPRHPTRRKNVHSDKFLKTIAGAMPENTTVMSGVGEDADAVLMAMQGMEAAAEVAGWDQRAEIMTVFSFPEALGLRTFPVPEIVLDDMSRHLPYLVELLKERDQAGTELFRNVLPESFFGILIMNEGWLIPATAENALEASLTKQVHVHPERVEIRFVICYTLDGRMLTVVRRRGELPENYEMTEDMIVAARIPDLLRRLALLCQEIAPSYVTERQLPE